MAVQVATRTSSSAGRLASTSESRPAIMIVDSESELSPRRTPRRHWHMSTRRPTHSASHPNGPGRWPAGAARRHWQAARGRPGDTARPPGPVPGPGGPRQARALEQRATPLSVAEQAPPEATRLQVSTLRAQACCAPQGSSALREPRPGDCALAGWLLAATGRGAINLKSGAPRPCDRKLIGSLA